MKYEKSNIIINNSGFSSVNSKEVALFAKNITFSKAMSNEL
jgi:hypothetical protein